jgi:hypothetical protein
MLASLEPQAKAEVSYATTSTCTSGLAMLEDKKKIVIKLLLKARDGSRGKYKQ